MSFYCSLKDVEKRKVGRKKGLQLGHLHYGPLELQMKTDTAIWKNMLVNIHLPATHIKVLLMLDTFLLFIIKDQTCRGWQRLNKWAFIFTLNLLDSQSKLQLIWFKKGKSFTTLVSQKCCAFTSKQKTKKKAKLIKKIIVLDMQFLQINLTIIIKTDKLMMSKESQEKKWNSVLIN